MKSDHQPQIISFYDKAVRIKAKKREQALKELNFPDSNKVVPLSPFEEREILSKIEYEYIRLEMIEREKKYNFFIIAVFFVIVGVTIAFSCSKIVTEGNSHIPIILKENVK